MLSALDLLLNGTKEIVISSPTAKASSEMTAEVFNPYIPDKVVIVATAKTYDSISGLSRLVEGRKPSAKPRAFVCHNFACKLPADSVESLRAQLESA